MLFQSILILPDVLLPWLLNLRPDMHSVAGLQCNYAPTEKLKLLKYKLVAII